MVNTLQNEPGVQDLILGTGALELVREGLTANKENIPSTHIDSMLCLSNMMNIKDIAVHNLVIASQESLFGVMILHYFHLSALVQLDECMIAYINALSSYPQYRTMVKDKGFTLNMMLLDRQLQEAGVTIEDTVHQCDNCRRRVFSTLMNVTETDKDIAQYA